MKFVCENLRIRGEAAYCFKTCFLFRLPNTFHHPQEKVGKGVKEVRGTMEQSGRRREVVVSALQFACSDDISTNIITAERSIYMLKSYSFSWLWLLLGSVVACENYYVGIIYLDFLYMPHLSIFNLYFPPSDSSNF